MGFVKHFSYDYNTKLVELFLTDVDYIADLDDLNDDENPKKMEYKTLYFNENIKDILITFLLNEDEEI